MEKLNQKKEELQVKQEIVNKMKGKIVGDNSENQNGNTTNKETSSNGNLEKINDALEDEFLGKREPLNKNIKSDLKKMKKGVL